MNGLVYRYFASLIGLKKAWKAWLFTSMLVLKLTPLAGAAGIEQARTYSEWLYSGNYTALIEKFSPAMVSAFPPAVLDVVRFSVVSSYGAEIEVLRETDVPIEGLDGFSTVTRAVVFEKVVHSSSLKTVMDVEWILGPGDVIYGFGFNPSTTEEAPVDDPDYQVKTPLRLPFDGEWFVFWGGRTTEQNYHAFTYSQRFAYDIVIVQDNNTHSGSGAENTDYYCFGVPILAPGGGVVVETADGIPDNVPGVMNAEQPLGNYVILDHGNGEYSVLAHLKNGSVTVQTGESVEKGQELGQCGNSGNSSEAHLHYHLQSGPVFGEYQSLPIQFNHYIVDGQDKIERGEPAQGQFIEHDPSAPSPVRQWYLY